MGLGPQHGIAGAILKGGSHFSKKFENAAAGMNAVHGIAIQGAVDAALRQQEHEHHLKNIEAAAKTANGSGFEVRTGHNTTRVGREMGKGKKSKPKGGEAETRNEETQDHYESAKEQAHAQREGAAPTETLAEGVENFKKRTMLSSDGKQRPAPGQRDPRQNRRPRNIKTDSSFRGTRAAKPAADDVEGNVKAATAGSSKKFDFAANRLQPTVKNYKKDK